MGSIKHVVIVSTTSEYDVICNLLIARIQQHPALCNLLQPIGVSQAIASGSESVIACSGTSAQADVFVLLMPEHFSEATQTPQTAMAQLAYQQALNHPATQMLVCLIKQAEQAEQASTCPHQLKMGVSPWQEKILGEVVPFTLASAGVEEITDHLLEKLLLTVSPHLIMARSGSAQQQHAVELLDALGEAQGMDLSNIHVLEQRQAQRHGISLIDTQDVIDAGLSPLIPDIQQPDAVSDVSADLTLIDTSRLPMVHGTSDDAKLGCAQPVNVTRHYQWAEACLALGRRALCQSAYDLAIAAIQIAIELDRPVHAAYGHVLAARALAQLGDTQRVKEHLAKAEDLAPRKPFLLLETARQYMREGQADEAMIKIRRLFGSYPKAIIAVYNDPELRSLRSATDEFIQDCKDKYRRQAIQLIQSEAKLLGTADGQSVRALTEQIGLKETVALARQAIVNQHHEVSRLLAVAHEMKPGEGVAELQAERERLLADRAATEVRTSTAGVEAVIAFVVSGLVAATTLVMGLYLYVSLAALPFIAGCLGLVRSKRKQRDRQDRLAQLATEIDAITRRIEVQKVAKQQATEDALKAFHIFETQSLQKSGKLIPYKHYPSHMGELVRMDEQAFEEPERYGISIVIQNDLPGWMPTKPDISVTYQLYRVVQYSPKAYVLSRWLAYQN